jgi:hypothetical protein
MKYKLEIEVVVEEKDEPRAIEVARECFRSNGGARGLLRGNRGGEEMSDIRPEEFINDVESALMELLEENPLFKRAGIEVIGVAAG